MITLRQFGIKDAGLICQRIYPGMSAGHASDLISEWNTCRYNGKAFRMLGVWYGDELVGTVSLLEAAETSVSFGIEIVPEFRRRGIGSSATELAFAYARDMGYHTVISQVRADNAASIALHHKLGFLKTGTETNRRGRMVNLYRFPL